MALATQDGPAAQEDGDYSLSRRAVRKTEDRSTIILTDAVTNVQAKGGRVEAARGPPVPHKGLYRSLIGGAVGGRGIVLFCTAPAHYRPF